MLARQEGEDVSFELAPGGTLPLPLPGAATGLRHRYGSKHLLARFWKRCVCVSTRSLDNGDQICAGYERLVVCYATGY